jgi:hypothetical protein
MGAVVEEATRKGEVVGSNPTGHVARVFAQKIVLLATGGPLLPLNSFFLF